jgi:anti-sigma factor RsiW
MGTSGVGCARAREWTSLRLDGELSELESRLLDAHLARCAGCRTCAAELDAVAVSLRSAPAQRLVSGVSVRRAPRRGDLTVGVVAALLAAAALAGLDGAVGSKTPTSPFGAAAAADSSPRGLPTTRLAALRQKPPPPVPRSLSLAEL